MGWVFFVFKPEIKARCIYKFVNTVICCSSPTPPPPPVQVEPEGSPACPLQGRHHFPRRGGLIGLPPAAPWWREAVGRSPGGDGGRGRREGRGNREASGGPCEGGSGGHLLHTFDLFLVWNGCVSGAVNLTRFLNLSPKQVGLTAGENHIF